MRKKEKSTFRKIEHHRTETFFLIVRGLEVGVVAGLVSALYRFLLSKAESANHAVLTAIAGKPLYIALFLAALAGIGYLVSRCDGSLCRPPAVFPKSPGKFAVTWTPPGGKCCWRRSPAAPCPFSAD